MRPAMKAMESKADFADAVIENQRGMTLLGYPLFSPRLLLPRFDPSNFQIMNCEKGTLHDIRGNHRRIGDIYPLDYSDQGGRWFVDMRVNNVDDQGWVYSWGFRQSKWRGRKGLVRRRIWVRGNDKMELLSSMPMIVEDASKPGARDLEKEEDTNSSQTPLVETLQKQLLDRYRFKILEGCDVSIFQDKELCQNIEDCFQYTSSKRRFQEWLKQK